MATVGGTSTDLVSGEGQPLKERVVTWQSPGVDGYGALKFGQGDSRFRFRLIHFDTLANVETWMQAIEAKQATVITIVDDHGATWANMLIDRVRRIGRKGVIESGASRVRGEMVIGGVQTA